MKDTLKSPPITMKDILRYIMPKDLEDAMKKHLDTQSKA